MVDQAAASENEEIRNKLKWLLGLRVFIVTLLMGASIALKVWQDGEHGSLPVFYFLIVCTYLLTILYGLLLQRISSLIAFVYVQIGVDLLLETSLVAVTGGLASPFTFLYIISIISASMILHRQGGMAAASASTVLFGVAGNMQYYGLIQTGANVVEPQEAIYSLVINIVAFFTVASLSSSLSEKLRQTRQSLQEKESGLTELKAFHENIVQSISSGLLTADLEGTLTSFNRAAQEITGLSWHEVKGKHCVEVMNWEGLREFYIDPDKINRSRRYDVETRKKDGTQLLLGVTLSPLRDEQGKLTGVVSTFQDLTKIRKLEAEVQKRQKLATIGQMAADMAHEIRNPLAALSGSMQVLRKELDLNEENQRLMDIALKETFRLDRIITEFLYFARPSPLNYKSCNLHTLLEETVRLLKNSKAYDHRIEIRTAFRKPPAMAWVDPDQMKQVFWNLSINAAQAMPEGGLLSISADMRNREDLAEHMLDATLRGAGRIEEAAGPRRFAEVVFEDTGGGIKREYLGRIFDPFFTTKSNGSGLGLAIVHRIIADHAGHIWTESQEGRGTRFTIELPVEPIGDHRS